MSDQELRKPKTYYSGDSVEEVYAVPDSATNVRLVISSDKGCYVTYIGEDGSVNAIGMIKDNVKADITVDHEW